MTKQDRTEALKSLNRSLDAIEIERKSIFRIAERGVKTKSKQEMYVTMDLPHRKPSTRPVVEPVMPPDTHKYEDIEGPEVVQENYESVDQFRINVPKKTSSVSLGSAVAVSGLWRLDLALGFVF